MKWRLSILFQMERILIQLKIAKEKEELGASLPFSMPCPFSMC
jgi:hypothetical protein